MSSLFSFFTLLQNFDQVCYLKALLSLNHTFSSFQYLWMLTTPITYATLASWVVRLNVHLVTLVKHDVALFAKPIVLFSCHLSNDLVDRAMPHCNRNIFLARRRIFYCCCITFQSALSLFLAHYIRLLFFFLFIWLEATSTAFIC